MYSFPTGEMCLKSWLMYWLKMMILPVVKPSTYESYRLICEKHIIPKLGDVALNNLSGSVIQRFLNEESACGNSATGGPLSSKTVRNIRVVLDVAMKQALAEGLIATNPIPLTAIRAVKSKRVEVMTDESQEELEKYLFETDNIYHGPIIMDLYTGMRRGEICALRWRDYDEKTNMLTVTQTVRRLTNYDAKPGEPKTKLVFNDVKTDESSRSLLMPPVLKELIREQKLRFAREFRVPQEDDFIFFSKAGGIIDPDNLQHYFAKLLKKLGLSHVKFHAIRHTFATRAIEMGIDVSTVSGILGHANVTTTTRFYVHPRDKAMRNAMSTIAPIYSSEKRKEKMA